MQRNCSSFFLLSFSSPTIRFMMRIILCLLVLFSPLCAAKPSFSPPHLNPVYLTWTHNPATTMTVMWHTSYQDTPSEIFYKKPNDTTWQTQTGSSHLVQGSLQVHTVELSHLSPDTYYIFRVGKTGASHTFRTLPDKITRPLKFVIGGDAYFSLSLFRLMNTQIAKQNPDFVVVGGDIAYTEGEGSPFKAKDWSVKRWQTFFDEWSKQMIAPDGRMIPIIPVIGNHDITKPAPPSPLFYEMFSFPEAGTSYRTLDIANTLSLIILDSDHQFPIAGEQTSWLENTLIQHRDFPYKFATYHVAAYPSYYKYDKTTPAQIRSHWVPLFEKHGIQTSFEHHNHTYKVSHPIKEGQVDPTGVLYLGDGSWGVKPRTPTPASKTWYLAQSGGINTVWVMTLTPEHCTCHSIDNAGKILDQIELISPSDY
jgi:hypothetical protein